MKRIRDLGRRLYWKMPSQIIDPIQALRNDCCSKKKIYRPYFDNTQSIFIHIPKAAGKSVSYALYGEDPQHHKLSSFETLDKDKFGKYFKFTFVRNPWSRLYSTYNYLVKQSNDFPYGKFSWINKYQDFEEFVLTGLTKECIQEYLFLNTQTSYLTDLTGKIAMDFIGKLETIAEDFKHVADMINKNAQLGMIGKNKERKAYNQGAYTDTMIDKVQELYQEDIDHFNYEF